MHRAEPVDCAILLSAECDLALDDGKTVHPKQSDVIVQHATVHAWVNSGSHTTRRREPAVRQKW
jgi:hypothetical protein